MANYETINGVHVFGDLDSQGALDQIIACKKDSRAVFAAMMGDHHLGYNMPIGGVVAYKNSISPTGVGFDIGCGNKAVRLDIDPEEVLNNLPKIMDDIQNTISFGVGRVNKEKVEHKICDDERWQFIEKILSESPYINKTFTRQDAINQLGTVGSGNHYVDLFIDEQNRVWLGVHFGSRGLGYRLASHFLKRHSIGDKDNIVLTLFKNYSDINIYSGNAYLQCMQFSGDYAYAGRDWVCDKIAKDILGSNIVEEVHNHHNYAWKENHEKYGDVWVVRKGATPAFPGQRGFVGGSMGENSVILEGVDSEISKYKTLYSTVHGAGRVLGRREAAGKFKWKRLKEGEKKVLVKTRKGKVTKKMMDDWLTLANVELRGGGLDESPHVYKRLDKVLMNHGSTIKIIHKLTPIGVCMAGSDEFSKS